MSIFPGTRAESARFGHAQAIVRYGVPVQFQLWVRISAAIVPTLPLLRGDGDLQDCGMMKECR
jgi:hypothetical protein